MLPDFPPFSFIENNEKKGLSFDILKLISNKSGLKLDFYVNKWPINLKNFKKESIDIIDSISFRQSRLSFTNFTQPYHESPLIIFSRKDLSTYTGISSLKGKKVGLTKDIFYKKEIENLNLFDIKEYRSFQDKLKALAFGEVDIIFGHLHSTQNSIEKNGYTNIQALDELKLENLKKTDLRFGVNKNKKLLTSIMNKSLDSISKQEWDKLNTKWLGLGINRPKKGEFKQVSLSKKESDFLKNTKIRCVITNSWAPFQLETAGRLSGIALDYWKSISTHGNIQQSCEKVDTFSQILNLIKNKQADLTLATAITKNKLTFANFSKSYISYPISIVTRESESFIPNTSYLENKVVAVGKDYSAYEILKNNYPDIIFVLTKNTKEALRLVSNGKAYAAVDILPVLSHQISNFGFSNLKISGTTEFNFDVRIMIRDDYKELVSIVNKSIDLITQEEKNNIGKKWTSVMYEKGADYSLLINVLIVFLFIGLYFLYKHVLLKKYNERLEKKIKIELQKNREKDMQLLHQSRLAQMGELISMIAHQWRQPLNSIAVTILNIQTHIDLNKFNIKDEKGKDALTNFTNKEFNNIDLYLGSLSETLDDFRNFYKPNNKAEVMNVHHPIQTSLKIIGSSLKNNGIRLIENYNSTCELLLFKNELMQVFINLLENSQDSFKEHANINPIINIETKDVKDGIHIEFRDNGSNIDENIIERIFEPYFSTKSEKMGSGLGLYMSKIIVEEHHKGRFSTKNYDNGVGFIIFLPLKA